MNEKKRAFVRLAPNSSRTSSFQISPSNVQQKRGGVISSLPNALPSLVPVDDNHSFPPLKSLYSDVSSSISQFICHSCINAPFRASLALLIQDTDTSFQTFHSTASKVFKISAPPIQHGHTNLAKTIGSSSIPPNNLVFGSQSFSPQRNFLAFTGNINNNGNSSSNNNGSSNNTNSNNISNSNSNAEANSIGQNLTELNLKTIKSATEPFLIAYVKLSNQIFNIKDSGFTSIIEGITNLFNVVFSVIEQLGALPSNTANVRENSKKISMTLRSNANQIHSSIRKLIQISSNMSSSSSFFDNSNNNDTEQKVKQIVSLVHDFSQMFTNSLNSDFAALIAAQECCTIRNDVLAALNDIIQGVRSITLFDSDILLITSSMSKFELKLKSFVFSIGLSFPSEEEISNNKYSHDNDNDHISLYNENNNDNQNASDNFDKSLSTIDLKNSKENHEDHQLNFDETMNVYELIQVAEKLFPKSIAVYSQDLSSSMLRFLSLLRGKLVEYETNFKKINKSNNEVEIQRIQKKNDIKIKQLENTISSLNQSLLLKNKDIDFFQNSPSMQYLQDVVSLLYAEDGQPANNSMKISEVDLIDPRFMKRLTDRVNELKSRKVETQSAGSDESEKCENAKKRLIQILDDLSNQQNTEDDILTLVEKCQIKIDDLKQGIEKSNLEMENIRKFAESLKEGINQLSSIFPSLSNELNSMNELNSDQNTLKIFELLKKSIEDEKKSDKSSDNLEMLDKLQSLSHLVVEKLSKFLDVTPPDKPLTESVEQLLTELENRQKE
ncbi:hypothetical protein M9Y10_044541 [Tritrichomonas musculus]|uniref:Uncharacterized protein n=1 Tax=Tritrichomonas musculus TaxID=1915356 RepID=A0ABR2JSX5_9EUKA